MMRTDRIQIQYLLEFTAPFHCGTGVRTGLIDRSVMRDGEGYLYVPASTIKGVVRELCEQLERFYEDSDDTIRELIATPHNKATALRDLGTTHTLVTHIFGSQICPGHLYFSDAQQLDDGKKKFAGENRHDDNRDEDEAKRYQHLQTDLYTQVRLNRLTRTAERGALYSSEFGIRHMTFRGNIIGSLECLPISAEINEEFSDTQDGPTYSLLLLLAGLYMIERLGGNKSTGKGECHCIIEELTINNRTIVKPAPENDANKNDMNEKPKPLWENWLQHLDVLSYYSLMLQEEA